MTEALSGLVIDYFGRQLGGGIKGLRVRHRQNLNLQRHYAKVVPRGQIPLGPYFKRFKRLFAQPDFRFFV